jgi:hypothetical protein
MLTNNKISQKVESRNWMLEEWRGKAARTSKMPEAAAVLQGLVTPDVQGPVFQRRASAREHVRSAFTTEALDAIKGIVDAKINNSGSKKVRCEKMESTGGSLTVRGFVPATVSLVGFAGREQELGIAAL